MTVIRRALTGAALLLVGAAARPAGAAHDLTYVAHEPAVTADHPPLIVLLHGAGADEQDMIGLWRQLPDTFVVVSLRAPFGGGGSGYRWYRNSDGVIARDADIAVSRKIIDVVLDHCIEHFRADPSRVFLAGFSQGAVMTYEMVLREPSRFRGAAVLSGTLFPSQIAGLPTATDHTRASVFIGHGTADERIPFRSTTAARVALAKLGVPTVFHAYPGLRHGTDHAEIGDLRSWLDGRSAP